MAIKPIVEVQHRGKRIRIEFAVEQRAFSTKYDIIVDGRPVRVGLFAEEVMRWLGNAMLED